MANNFLIQLLENRIITNDLSNQLLENKIDGFVIYKH